VIFKAFSAESLRLLEEMAATSDVEFDRPSPCAPWTVAELAYHVRMGMGRLHGMLTEPEPEPERESEPGPPARDALVSAPGYYRADHRFSAAVDGDRIESARRGAAALPDAAALTDDFAMVRGHACELVLAAPAERVVRTRHGDLMSLTEFLRTRVLELAVHGLDLAAALDREPWMTPLAAQVTEELLLPAPAAATLRARIGWDRMTLIGALTGRRGVTPAEARLVDDIGAQRLALG
jgi:uncharacterized protein (TIGR03083 family)